MDKNIFHEDRGFQSRREHNLLGFKSINQGPNKNALWKRQITTQRELFLEQAWQANINFYWKLSWSKTKTNWDATRNSSAFYQKKKETLLQLKKINRWIPSKIVWFWSDMLNHRFCITFPVHTVPTFRLSNRYGLSDSLHLCPTDTKIGNSGRRHWNQFSIPAYSHRSQTTSKYIFFGKEKMIYW